MGVPIQIVATHSMDLFYQQYKSSSDFWSLEDFIAHCTGIVANIYNQGYNEQRAEFRQEKKDDVVAFDPNTLNSQILKVERNGSELFAELERPIMSFPYDTQGIGAQEVIPTKPLNGVKLQRATLATVWQLQHTPYVNTIWWYVQRAKIKFINKGICNIGEVEVLYVPSINDPDFEVPDGIYEFVVMTAAATIKQGANGVVIKKGLDYNQNKTLETEIDKSQLK